MKNVRLPITLNVYPAPSPAPEVDLSIVIAHRGPLIGLWTTIESCINELSESPHSYNFVVVVNGEPETMDHAKIKMYLGKSGKLRNWIQHDDPMSPPNARQLGTRDANGKLLFFLDNHCIPKRHYFDRAVEMLKRDDIDMLHSTTEYYSGFELGYHYDLCLQRNFWGTGNMFAPDDPAPYKAAMGGHGGFAIKRAVWDEVGGYWGGFQGYGGEESYFDLKMWLMGKSVWLDPKMVHVHFAGERPYPRHFSDDYYRNMMMTANIIGGSHWLDTVSKSFIRGMRRRSDVEFFDLVLQAQERSQSHADWLASKRTQTLDEFLSTAREQGIAH